MNNSHIFYLAIIGLLVLALLMRGGEKVTHKQDIYQTYTTDTIFSKKVYQDILSRIDGLEEKLKETPPKEVIYYPEYDTIEKPVIVERVPDSILLYIGALKEKISISDKFFKNFPKAHKLVDFQLTRENFNVSTVDLGGNVIQRKYPLALNEYDYYWANNTLRHLEAEDPYSPSKWGSFNELYLNLGYEVIQSAPLLGVDYQLRYSKFKLSTQANSIITPDGIKLRGDVKLGYRLFK